MTKTCIICSSQYETTVPHQKVCSSACRKQHKKNLDEPRKKDPKEREKRKAAVDKWRSANADSLKEKRSNNYKENYIQNQIKKYNISYEQASALFLMQKCEICLGSVENKQVNKITTDHDHITGKVRGRLCDGHNRALGLFSDDVELLQKAITYLQRGAFFKEEVNNDDL